MLAHFHIADHRVDSRRLRWKLAARLVSPRYRRAAARLKAWQFPLDEMAAILGTQTAREAHPESLEHVAEPTAAASAAVFSHGMRVAGHADRADAMYSLGHRFGSLVYLLDAYEDRARDAKRDEFNALEAFPGIDAREEILARTSEIERRLSPDLAARLRSNVEERLGMRRRVLHCRCRKPLRERWREAVALARSMRERERAGAVKGAAVLASVSALAFLFPHQARAAESWRQCLGVTMNLMAIGTVFAAVQIPPSVPGGVPKPKGCGSCGSCCDSCVCDGCDSCDCSDCCGSCCSSCDC